MANGAFIRRGGFWVPLTSSPGSGVTPNPGTFMPSRLTTAPDGVYSANPCALGALTPLYGDQIINNAGTTLINRDIFGFVKIRAANVSILGCRVRGYVTGTLPGGATTSPATTSTGLIECISASCVNAIINDNYLVPDNPNQYVDAVLGGRYTALRNYCIHCVDGFGSYNISGVTTNADTKGWWNFVDKHAWFFPAAGHSNGSHCDGLQHQGGNNANWQGNRWTGLIDPTVGQGSQWSTERGQVVDPTTGLPLANSAIQLNTNTGPFTTGCVFSNNFAGGGDLETYNFGSVDGHIDDCSSNVFDGNNGGGRSHTWEGRVGLTYGRAIGNVFTDGTVCVLKNDAG